MVLLDVFNEKFKFKKYMKNYIIQKEYVNLDITYISLNSRYICNKLYIRYVSTFLKEHDYFITSKEASKVDLKAITCCKCEIKTDDTILKNIMKYLLKYNLNEKILLIISNSIDSEVILSLINKFKIVDVLITNNNSNFKKIINNINLEYGTSIKVIQSNNLQSYDIYGIINDVNLSSYILNYKAKCLDLTNSDNDIYSEEYTIFNQNIHVFETIYNIDKFSKCKIGKYLKMEELKNGKRSSNN